MNIKKWPTVRELSHAEASDSDDEEPVDLPHPLLILGCLLIAVAAAAGEAYMINQFRTAWAAESWPSTRGVIMRSVWAEQPGSGKVEAEIQYQYIVDEQIFNGQKVGFGDRIPKSQQQATLDRYPLESEVQVYYDPANPAVAYLERGVGIVNYVTVVSPLVFSIGMFLATIEMCRMHWREARK